MINNPKALKQFAEEDKTFLVFKEVSKELKLSSQQVSRITGRLFSAISRSLSKNELAYWLDNLPELFKLLLVKDWKSECCPSTLEHLDHLVDTVYTEDQRTTDKVFRSEVEALEYVVVLLKKMEKVLGILRFPGFKFSFVREVKQVNDLEIYV